MGSLLSSSHCVLILNDRMKILRYARSIFIGTVATVFLTHVSFKMRVMNQ